MGHEKCFACGASKKKDVELKLHRFPKNPAILNQWKHFCILFIPNFYFCENDDFQRLWLCSRHFEPSDYNPPHSKYLRKNAVPTLTGKQKTPKQEAVFIKIEPDDHLNSSQQKTPHLEAGSIKIEPCNHLNYSTQMEPCDHLNYISGQQEISKVETIFTETETPNYLNHSNQMREQADALHDEEFIEDPLEEDQTECPHVEALPCIDHEEDQIECPHVEALPCIDHEEATKKGFERRTYLGDFRSSDMMSPKRATEYFHASRALIDHKNKKLKILNQKCSRMKKNIANLKQLVKHLSKGYLISENAEEVVTVSYI